MIIFVNKTRRGGWRFYLLAAFDYQNYGILYQYQVAVISVASGIVNGKAVYNRLVLVFGN